MALRSMELWYRLAADVVVFVHFAYVLFVIAGLGVVLAGAGWGWQWTRNIWFRGLHLLAIAIVALPNDGSIAVHEKLGYEVVGTLEEVGFKDDRYWSTTVMQRKLG